MISQIRKAVLMGLGAVSLTRDRAEKVIDEMVKKGEMTREEAREFFEDLVEKGKEEREHIRSMLSKEMERFKRETDFASKRELAELEARVTELEARLHKENGQE